MLVHLKHLHFVTFWMAFAFCLPGCRTTVTKERAKDYVNDFIEYHNTQLVGGSTMKNARVEIVDVRQVNYNTLVIAYTWSGTLKAPLLANPKPDETITNKAGVLELHLKNGKWVFIDD